MTTDAATAPEKFRRKKQTHQEGLTIWEIPDAGLYRVREVNLGRFDVETLTTTGWIHLIHLDAGDRVTTPLEAMQAWLDIQTPSQAGRA